MQRLLRRMKARHILFGLIALLALIWVISDDRKAETIAAVDPNIIRPSDAFDNHYHHVRSAWDVDAPTDVAVEIPATAMGGDITDGAAYGYDGDVRRFERGDVITLNVTIDEAGAYRLSLDYLDIGTSILTNRLSVKINGAYQFEESHSIDLLTEWRFATDTFTRDRYGNEILPNSVKHDAFIRSSFYDATALNAEPLTFLLDAGANTIELVHRRGELLIGSLWLKSPRTHQTYDEYLALHEGAELQHDANLILGAETFVSKTSPSTRLRSERNPGATSYDTRSLRLNAIDGWSFRHGNNTITYEIDVETAGFYHIGINYRQNYLMQMPVFREIRVNGDVPFDTLRMVPFHFSNTYTTMMLGDGENPYKIYLDEGVNTFSMRVVLEPYRNAYEHVIQLMSEMTDLSLEIRRLTGNTQDRYRTWRLETRIPDIHDRLARWIETLKHVHEGLSTYSEHHSPGELTNLSLAIDQLQRLADNVNNIPNRMQLLADGDASTAQLLGTMAQIFLENGLDLEHIYVGGDPTPPRTRPNMFVRASEGVQRFFLSFFIDDYSTGEVGADTIEIWVNYPRPYVEIMQQIIDSEFTAQTGIPVQLSLMPDENKLILASAANRAPDVALGVNHWIPYEFAIRGASMDLRQFPGYADTVANFAPGVMIPYAFEDGMYGMPLTQNFWVTFYRTDIFESLNLPVPDTWDDVIEILPELQRFGMNFYHPLAMFGGFKPFVATIPFIYQFGGDLYSDDGMQTTLNTEENLEGIRLMSDLFTIYNLPKQAPNFYNHFRTGLLPIGVSDLATYLQLTVAAPEIAGQWEIAPHPGVRNVHGDVERWAASGAQSMMILADTKMPNESWQFLEWWMSTDTQVNFATRLQTTYGTEFLWNTANLEAFAQIPLPEEHVDIILTQWEFALEASRIPGTYMVERELSNAWNKIVFNDANPRIALDTAVRIANREIIYRMEEFGYAEDGVSLRPYLVPTIHTIDYWLKEHDDD